LKGNCLTLAACVCLFLGATGVPVDAQSFSANFSSTSKSQAGNTIVTGKIFTTLLQTRMDMQSHGRSMSVIGDATTQTSYMIMHDQRIYMEYKRGQANPMARTLPPVEGPLDPRNPCLRHTDSTCKDLGPETRSGRACEKWLLTRKDGISTTVWVDQTLQFPIRSESSNGSLLEFSNIKEGPQAAALFQVPNGYRKMDMSMMGGPKRPQ